jgi:toxin ParE1/3/4
MSTVVWTPAAQQDLEEIFLYIGRDRQSPSAAAQVVRDIAAKAVTYAEQPLLGEARPEFAESIRVFRTHRYAIFYRGAPAGIEVLRVVHGSRDILKVFGQRDA